MAEKVTMRKPNTLTPQESTTPQSIGSVDTIPTSSIHDNQRIGSKQRGV